MRIALTVAGSDSGGGAGIQADLKTFHRFGLFGTSVITAITAQNTIEVAGWLATPADLVTAQLDAVASDLRPAAVKSGMLGSEDVVRALADGIRKHGLSPYVLDPVMAASSGDPLLERQAITAVRRELLPLAHVVTPNLDEAAILVGETVSDVAGMESAARWLVEVGGARAALVKGGHLEGNEAVDVLFDGDIHVMRHPMLRTRNTHGTGCTLSAAIAAGLALGNPLADAIRTALDYVHHAIESAPELGGDRGHGPLNHFAELRA